MIEPELGLLQVQVKRRVRDAVELGQAAFGVAPEALDAVDVARASRELVSAMMDPQMLFVTDVHQPVVPPPAVGMDDDLRLDLASNNSQKRAFGAVGDASPCRRGPRV